MRKLGLVFCAVGALSLAGCVTSTHKQITELKRPAPQTRIILMPLDVELAELSAAGIPEPKADWTTLATQHMVAALRSEKAARNIQMIEYSDDGVAPERRDDLDQLVKLHGAVGNSVLLHQYIDTLRLPTKAGRFDWSLGPTAKSLKDAFGADYALFVFVRDSYTSAGRAAVIVIGALLGVGIQGGTQVGFASLVDLDNGDIVWFNRLARATGDLRTEPAARETVRTLIADLPK